MIFSNIKEALREITQKFQEQESEIEKLRQENEALRRQASDLRADLEYWRGRGGFERELDQNVSINLKLGGTD